MRLIYLTIGFLCLFSASYAQSHDEEESVHFEGSANAPSDDEDIIEEVSIVLKTITTLWDTVQRV